MSRPRSRSPHYRRLPWEKPNYNSHQGFSEQDGNLSGHLDRSHRPEENRNYFREDRFPGGQRSPPRFQDQFGRHQEDFYHKRISPRRDDDETRYEDRRPIAAPPHPPQIHDGAVDVDRRGGGGGGGGFREQRYHGFENQRRSPQSPPPPLRFKKERFPQRSHHSEQRETSWRREEQGRGRPRFSPTMSLDEQRDKGWRSENQKRQRELPPHQERNLQFKKQRRQMDGSNNHLGYHRNEEDFGGQGFSGGDIPRDEGFGGDRRGNLMTPGDVRQRHSGSGPLVVEHDHGLRDERGGTPRWQENHREPPTGFDPRQREKTQERFRVEDSRGGLNFGDNPRDFHDTRRSPDNQGGFRGGRRRYNNHSGRIGPPRDQGSYQDVPHEDQRGMGYQQRREDHKKPVQEGPKWTGEDRVHQWEHHDRPHQNLNRHIQRREEGQVDDLDVKIPRQRERGWINHQKTDDMTVVTEETLKIKVDTSRPANLNSPLCYSSDRQLSLDLVNVGRQRLDFLPMLEHSGTYRETAMHTGTFAQEIITLVHLVKEQYFRDDGVTLNERFSKPQKTNEEEVEELTLDQRFSSNRGFNLDLTSLHDDDDDDEPLFARLGPMQGLGQPVRGPGDLRHDLERRRQEKLEGVKVTIQGNNMSQRHLGAARDLDMQYNNQPETSQMDDNGFSNWSDDQIQRRDGRMGPRRGPSNRPVTGPQRRNNRYGNRRPNVHNGPTGSNW